MKHKILFVAGLQQDKGDMFRGIPSSLLYAIAPTVQVIDSGQLEMEYVNSIFEPTFFIEGYNDLSVKKTFREIIEKERVTIICASSTYDSIYPVLQLFRSAKEINPEIISILGGAHFDEVHTQRHLNNNVDLNPNIVDVGIAGDGEYSLLSVLRAIISGKPRKGILDLDTSQILGRASIYTPWQNIVINNGKLPLDKLPFMPIRLIRKEHRKNFDIFRDSGGDIVSSIQLMTQRGCPFPCSFCSESRLLAYPNQKSINKVMEEIYWAKDLGYQVIFFDDSDLGSNPMIEELLIELRKTGLRFGTLNRFDFLVDPKIVRLYKEAGFEYVYCSIERLDNSALHSLGKHLTEEQIRQSLNVLSDYDIKVGTSLLYGLSSNQENFESVRKTHRFVQEWAEKGRIIIVSQSLLSAHSGTQEGQEILKRLSIDKQRGVFHQTPPHLGDPWNRFEEGQWYHYPDLTEDYIRDILQDAEACFGRQMARNRHNLAEKQ